MIGSCTVQVCTWFNHAIVLHDRKYAHVAQSHVEKGLFVLLQCEYEPHNARIKISMP